MKVREKYQLKQASTVIEYVDLGVVTKYHQQIESPYLIAFGHIAILTKMHFILVILTEN